MTAKIIQFRDYERKHPRTDADRLRDLATPKTLAEAVRCINELRQLEKEGGPRTGQPIWPPEDMVPKEGA